MPIAAFDVVGCEQQPLTPLAGSGRGLWSKDSTRALRRLRGEWSRWNLKHTRSSARFAPLSEVHAGRRLRFAADEALARRYRTILESWQAVPRGVEITQTAARLPASR